MLTHCAQVGPLPLQKLRGCVAQLLGHPRLLRFVIVGEVVKSDEQFEECVRRLGGGKCRREAANIAETIGQHRDQRQVVGLASPGRENCH